MILKKVSKKALRNAVVRILTGPSTVADEAERVGCSTRTIERAIQKARKGMVDQAAPSSPPAFKPAPDLVTASVDNVVKLEATPEPEVDDDYKKALEAAGVPIAKAPEPDKPITAQEVVAATKDAAEQDAEHCIQILGGAKSMLTGTVIDLLLDEPADSPEFVKYLELRPETVRIIKANASALKAEVDKVIGNSMTIVYVTLLGDVVATGLGIWKAVKTRAKSRTVPAGAK